MRHIADIFGRFWENESFNLHNHTVYSDGVHTPEELVTEAKSKLISVLSVTDHDTIGAYTKGNLLQIANAHNIQIVPWFEATVKWPKIHGYAPHLLMYFNEKHISNSTFVSDLQDTIGQARTKVKLEKQLANLKMHYWLDLTLAHFEDQAIDDNFSNITSRNIKQVIRRYYPLIDNEYIKSIFHYTSPAYIDIGTDIETLMYLRYKYDMVSVLAHPILKSSQNPNDHMFDYVKSLEKKWYLDGLELYHPDINDAMRSILKKVEVILHTAGSDTHNKHIWIWSRPMYNTERNTILNPLEIFTQKAKTAVMIGRLNPPHIGHIRVINKALAESETLVMFLGSANVVNEKNPFTFEERKSFLEANFSREIASKKLIISSLDDVGNNALWTENLWKKVKTLVSDFDWILNFYGWDFAEDRAINAIRENENKLSVETALYTQVPRDHFTLPDGQEISATNLRKALQDGDDEMARKFLLPKIADQVLQVWKQKNNQ